MINSNRFNPDKGYLITFPDSYLQQQGNRSLSSITEDLFQFLVEEANFSDKLDVCYISNASKREVQIIFKKNFPTEKLLLTANFIRSLIPDEAKVEIIGRGLSSPIKTSFDKLRLLDCEPLPISISLKMAVN